MIRLLCFLIIYALMLGAFDIEATFADGLHIKLNGWWPRLRKRSRLKNPHDGQCCSCGYTGEAETRYPEQEDEIHCVHWGQGGDDDR